MKDRNIEPFGFIAGEDDVFERPEPETSLLVTKEIRELFARANVRGFLVVRASSDLLRELTRRGYFVAVASDVPGTSTYQLSSSGRELAAILGSST